MQISGSRGWVDSGDGSVIPLLLRAHYQAMVYVLAGKDGILMMFCVGVIVVCDSF